MAEDFYTLVSLTYFFLFLISLLLLASSGGHYQVVEYLLKNGVNVNDKDNFECSSLFLGI
jgi:hypothetical protein